MSSRDTQEQADFLFLSAPAYEYLVRRVPMEL